MELIFNKVGKYYESVFELTADANLHIEFNNASPVKLYQRTTGGGWDLVDDVKNAVGKVTDIDLTALIYPKYIKVVCRTEPTYAEVVSNGEITELKYQEKSVEVTANGNTEVIPDAGFAGLTKVNVSVNVPQSGGSGSGGGNSSIEYLDVSSPSPIREAVIGFANLMKTEDTNINYPGSSSILNIPTGITPIGNLFQSITGLGYEGYTAVLNSIKAVSIDFSTPIIMGENNPIITIKQVFSEAEEMLDAIPRLTEEEFYNLES